MTAFSHINNLSPAEWHRLYCYTADLLALLALQLCQTALLPTPYTLSTISTPLIHSAWVEALESAYRLIPGCAMGQPGVHRPNVTTIHPKTFQCGSRLSSLAPYASRYPLHPPLLGRFHHCRTTTFHAVPDLSRHPQTGMHPTRGSHSRPQTGWPYHMPCASGHRN